MAKKNRDGAVRQARRPGLELDQALIALFIGALTANGHVAADEASRAQHLIGTTRRFRRKSGEAVGKMIHDMRSLLEELGADALIDQAAAAIPARVRPSAFAVLADLLLADGKIDAQERTFLRRIGSKLAIEPGTIQEIVEVVLVKNQL